LKAYGYTTITLEDFITIRDGTMADVPDKPVVITLDDGYTNVYTHVFPAVEERGMVFTSFVITSFGPEDFLSWDEIREMRNAGQFFESHTVSHPDLDELYSWNPSGARAEIVDSKADLESEMPGYTVKFLAYPYGGHNNSIKQMVREAGYQAAVSTISGIENTAQADLWALKRQEINRNTVVDYDPSQPYNFFMYLVDRFQSPICPSVAEVRL
jgi:peptidoglycan/xylan/chitin deacetylase (PgdA/CDA1 family)